MEIVKFFFKFNIVFFSLFLATSCAQPKYVKLDSAPGAGGVGDGAEKNQADCTFKFEQSQLCLSLIWKNEPQKNQTNSFLFKIYRANKADGSMVLLDQLADLKVVLWMPSMGHGSSPVSVEKVDVGTYLATNVYFIMGGDWEIQFFSEDSSLENKEDQLYVPITLAL